MGGNGETKVAQNLRAEPVAQSNIFEPNQVQLRSVKGRPETPENRRPQPTGPVVAGNQTKEVLLRLWFPIRSRAPCSILGPCFRLQLPRGCSPQAPTLENERHRHPRLPVPLFRFEYPQRARTPP